MQTVRSTPFPGSISPLPSLGVGKEKERVTLGTRLTNTISVNDEKISLQFRSNMKTTT